jgi:hypothetical protein
MAMIPAAAFVAVPPIAKSMVDAAIKSNVRAPINMGWTFGQVGFEVVQLIN